ncbi:MAG TPA: DUF4339 domain-containing protein, partial [Verrucomicrobiae bacterium]|nr:DUF4339 domain-containing protein [Verrucomicrobiae bacterium]
MPYQLHSQGKDLGVFTVEELLRRRQLGELSGEEFVWREGMSDWQPIDSVLGGAVSPPLPTTAVVSRGKLQRAMPWLIAAGSVVLLLSVVVAGIVGLRASRHAPESRPSAAIEKDDVDGEAEVEEGVAAAQKQVPAAAKSGSRTEREVRKQSGEFRTRQWLDAYQERGNHNTECDALAKEMLGAWIQSNFGTPDTNGPSVEEMCDSLAATAGCTDPLVLTVTALNATEINGKIERLERALQGFETSRHRAYPRLCAAVNLMIAAGGKSERRTSGYRTALRALSESFRDGSFRPEDQEEIGEILVNGWGSTLLKSSPQGLHLAVSQAGPAFEWLALVLAGEYEISEAWRARGRGYANTVTPEGWKGFEAHRALAKTNLDRAWKLNPNLPLAPSRMI